MTEVEIIGQTIIDVRDANDEEKAQEGWSENFKVIVLDNGVKIYPSRDYECN